MKERYKCPNCDTWGDALDLIRHKHPEHQYTELEKLLVSYTESYNGFLWAYKHLTDDADLIDAAYDYTKERGEGWVVHPKPMRFKLPMTA
jgi:hypothetical protein